VDEVTIEWKVGTPPETAVIHGKHVFTPEEFFFKGHFPEYPVVPGVILIETMAQMGGAGLCKTKAMGEGALFFLASVDKAKFRKQVRPGDEVRGEIRTLRLSTRTIKQAGKLYLGKDVAAEAEWLCIVGSTDTNGEHSGEHK
jgi:3-hydroxyacyl-[acyl-carrier-protein] dehydratase